MKTPCFLEKGVMFNPHSRPKSVWTAVPFPDLHSAPSQLASQGHELQDMPAAAGKRPTLWEMGGSQVCALGPHTAQLCPAGCVLGRQITRRWEGPCTHVLSTHAHAWPSARCEPSCCEPPPLCLHFSCVIYHPLL